MQTEQVAFLFVVVFGLVEFSSVKNMNFLIQHQEMITCGNSSASCMWGLGAEEDQALATRGPMRSWEGVGPGGVFTDVLGSHPPRAPERSGRMEQMGGAGLGA